MSWQLTNINKDLNTSFFNFPHITCVKANKIYHYDVTSKLRATVFKTHTDQAFQTIHENCIAFLDHMNARWFYCPSQERNFVTKCLKYFKSLNKGRQLQRKYGWGYAKRSLFVVIPKEGWMGILLLVRHRLLNFFFKSVSYQKKDGRVTILH